MLVDTPRVLPNVYVTGKKHKRLWNSLWVANGNGNIKFDDWSDFLTSGVGYRMTPQGGSGYRFVLLAEDGSSLDAIVYHNVHGRDDVKIVPVEARGWERGYCSTSILYCDKEKAYMQAVRTTPTSQSVFPHDLGSITCCVSG